MDEQQPVDNKRLFYKLVRLHRWDEQRGESRAAEAERGALAEVAALAARREGFAEAMREVEEWLETPDSKKPDDPARPEELKRLYALLEGSPRLREVFSAEPPFSGAAPRAVETLARFADVTPDGQAMLNTRDAVLMGVLEAAQDAALAGPPVNLFDKHLGKALAVQRADEATAARLAALPDEHWSVVLSSLEDGRDYTDGPESAAGRLLSEWQPPPPDELRIGFGRPPRLSQIEPRLFKLLWATRAMLGPALRKLPEGSLGTAQASALRPAGETADRLLRGVPAGEAGDIRDFFYALRLRDEMARHLVEVRKEAKVETLIYKWPRAARLALDNPAALRGVESHLLRRNVLQELPSFTTDEERELYKLAQEDTQFARLLHTRPHFGDIALFQYLSAERLPGVAEPATAPARTAERQPARDADAATKTEPVQTTRQPPTERTPRGAAGAAERTDASGYLTHLVTVTDSGPLADEPETHWMVEIVPPAAGEESPFIPLGRHRVMGTELAREMTAAVVGDFPESADPLPLIWKKFSSPDGEYLFQVFEAGLILAEKILGRHAGELGRLLRTDEPTRVAIEHAPELWAVPWEWLALPGDEYNFVLNPRRSLVRCLPPPLPRYARGSDEDEDGAPPLPKFQRRLKPPLRVLLLTLDFNDPTRVENEGRWKPFFDEMSRSGAEVTWLPGNITVEGLRAELNGFLPHVLHIQGELGQSSRPGETQMQPCIFLSAPLFADQLRKELKTAGVRLLVMHDTPRSGHSPFILQRFLDEFGLVGEGVPAALANVRPMDDKPAFEFLSGFYRALLGGKGLEEAVAAARLELLGKGGDWSAFALFAHLPTLQSSPILPKTDRTRPQDIWPYPGSQAQ